MVQVILAYSSAPPPCVWQRPPYLFQACFTTSLEVSHTATTRETSSDRQLHACSGGFSPFRKYLPRMAYFQRTGSWSVWVRALRQWRSRLCSASVERVPASSNSLLVAAIAISVDRILASAVTICASATVSALGFSTARSIA